MGMRVIGPAWFIIMTSGLSIRKLRFRCGDVDGCIGKKGYRFVNVQPIYDVGMQPEGLSSNGYHHIGSNRLSDQVLNRWLCFSD